MPISAQTQTLHNHNISYTDFRNCNFATREWIFYNTPPSSYTSTISEHIIDFLKFKGFHSLEWASWELLKEKADKWSKMLQQNVATIDEVYGEDIETVLDFQDGFRFVKLISQNSYKREGNLMSHCVSGYFGRDVEIYSLRDEWNKPHCTIEKDSQIKGKGNGVITNKYVDYIVKFLEWSGMEVRDSEMSNLGYERVPFLEYCTTKNLFRGRYALKESIVEYGEYKVTSSINEATQPGKWLYKGTIVPPHNAVDCDENNYIYAVRGDIRSCGEGSISLPNCTHVEGPITSDVDSIISLPLCTRVTGTIMSHHNSTILLPICTCIDGGVFNYSEITISLPLCTRIGHGLSQYASFTKPNIDTPKLKKE